MTIFKFFGLLNSFKFSEYFGLFIKNLNLFEIIKVSTKYLLTLLNVVYHSLLTTFTFLININNYFTKLFCIHQVHFLCRIFVFNKRNKISKSPAAAEIF